MDTEKGHLTDVERLEQSTTEGRRLLNQEKLILEVTEALSEAIEAQGITRSEVAKRLGKTKGFVSQLLAGSRNLTLRTLADLADAVGVSLKVAVEGRKATSRKWDELARIATQQPDIDVWLRTETSWQTDQPFRMRRQNLAFGLRYSIHGGTGQGAQANGEQWAA